MPVFLFTGPEEGEKKSAIETLKKSLKKNAQVIDEFTFYAFETEVPEVVMILQNESLFAAARFVLFRGAENIKKKEDIDALSAWIEEDSRGGGISTLVMESAENSVDKRLENKVPKENKRIFWEMFENKKEAWVRDFFAKQGRRITDEGIAAILGLVENNTETLRSECSRFFLTLPKDHVIGAEDAESILSHNREESAFSLFDALTRQGPPEERFENALGILQRIRGSKEGSPQGIIAGLVWCFRRIADWRALCATTPNPSPFDCKKAGFGHPEAQRQYKSAARLWPRSEPCLALLSQADMETRTAPEDLQNILLETMIYSLVFKQGAGLEAGVF